MKGVPVVDIAAARSGDESALTETARAVDAACIESGFFNVTGHGVPTDRARDRMSVPFFFQPSYGTSIETIPTTITPDRPAKYDPVVSGTWITAKSTAMLDDQE